MYDLLTVCFYFLDFSLTFRKQFRNNRRVLLQPQQLKITSL